MPPNKLWAVQGREFYNDLMQKWLHGNDILMYLTHNEGMTVVAQRIIKTLISKIYKKTKSNDGTFYLGYLNKLADQDNNTYHRSVSKKTY